MRLYPKVCILITEKGGSEGPLEMLNEFEGYLQTDGYGVYPQFALK